MYFINSDKLNKTIVTINQRYNTDVALVTYSDKNDMFSTTKVFRNYVKLYVNNKIALEIKFDAKTYMFKEFMHNAKRSDYIAEKLLATFSDRMTARVTKKQCFIQCDNMNDELMIAVILYATKFANEYDNNFDNARLYVACNKAKKALK